MTKEYVEAILEAMGITNYIIKDADDDETYDLLIPIVNDAPFRDGRIYGMSTRRDETLSAPYFCISFKDPSKRLGEGIYWRQELE